MNSLTFHSPEALARALRQAADNHHAYEEALGHSDPDWQVWYASYMWTHYGPPVVTWGHNPVTPLGMFAEGDPIPDHTLPSRLNPR